ncbi:MAG: family transcriptional regulator [Labilithrix sp.]|nr:family transcriptional regulator [Labilithrix sp.]
MARPSHNALGDFLRSRRERLDPAALGLPTLRRRTPGLRREEVAARAGIGADWYLRLEQGRSSTPSAATVEALGRALQLTVTELAHLRALTRIDRPAPFAPEQVPPAMMRVVASLRGPAYVTGRRLDVLAWNPAAGRLFGLARLPEHDRNTLALMFLVPSARELFGSAWESEARRVLAAFRATHDLLADDPAFASLLARLKASPEFARWWKAHDVRQPRSGIKVFHHPKLGTCAFEHSSYQSNDDPSLRLVVLVPAGPGRATSPPRRAGP